MPTQVHESDHLPSGQVFRPTQVHEPDHLPSGQVFRPTQVHESDHLPSGQVFRHCHGLLYISNTDIYSSYKM